MTYVVPYVPKEDITIVSVGDALEAITVRALLESYNYRVTMHWIGSRKELLEVLAGNIEIYQICVLSCHGIKEGIIVPDEPSVGANEIAQTAKLTGKTIINLGCLTGSKDFVQAFKDSGAKSYIAPVEYPESRAAINFVSNLFVLLAANTGLSEAVQRAAAFDKETEQFKFFNYDTINP